MQDRERSGLAAEGRHKCYTCAASARTEVAVQGPHAGMVQENHCTRSQGKRNGTQKPGQACWELQGRQMDYGCQARWRPGKRKANEEMHVDARQGVLGAAAA